MRLSGGFAWKFVKSRCIIWLFTLNPTYSAQLLDSNPGSSPIIQKFWEACGLLILQGCTGLRPGTFWASLERTWLLAGQKSIMAIQSLLWREQGTKAGRAQFVVVHASEDQTALALISAFAATTKPGQNLTNLN